MRCQSSGVKWRLWRHSARHIVWGRSPDESICCTAPGPAVGLLCCELRIVCGVTPCTDLHDSHAGCYVVTLCAARLLNSCMAEASWHAACRWLPLPSAAMRYAPYASSSCALVPAAPAAMLPVMSYAAVLLYPCPGTAEHGMGLPCTLASCGLCPGMLPGACLACRTFMACTVQQSLQGCKEPYGRAGL